MSIDVSQLDALGEEEYNLELEALDMGIARYQEIRRNVPASDYTPEQRFIVDGMDTLVPYLMQISDKIQSSTAMPRLTKWAVPFLALPVEKLALLTLMVLFNEQGHSHIDRSHAALMNAVARAVKLEVEFTELKEEKTDVFKKLSHRVKTWTRNKRGIMWARRMADLAHEPWSVEQRMALGWVLVNAAIEATHLFAYERGWNAMQQYTAIVLNPATKDAIERQHSDLEILRPFCYPMVVTPKDWEYDGETLTTGGYVYMQSPIIKPGFASVNEAGGDLDFVCQGLNILQRTGWNVNETVRGIAKHLWTSDGDMAGLPKREPRWPDPMTQEEKDDPSKAKAYRDKARQIYDENAREGSKRVATQMCLDLSKRFGRHEVLFMPHQLCFRGRAYPLPSLLQPQGEDLSRGLLRFSKAKPLGDTGFRELAIHVANCIGWDKCSFNERYERVLSHQSEIAGWALDPLEHRGWMDVDSPFQTLAGVYELHAAWNHREDFLSRIPCAIDGSCNGLQHLSALGRDPIGGAAVNLIPSGVPSDIYTDVANVVVSLVERDCNSTGKSTTNDKGESFVSPCWAWRGHVDRSVVKRAVMTTPYGLTAFGMRDQFRTDGHLVDLDGSPKENGKYLAEKMEVAIGSVVVQAALIMAWLQEIAIIAGRAGHHLTWWTPTGMDVTQKYRVMRSKRLTTTMGEVYYKKRTKKLSVGKQASGIAPNYIHSLDAAHMMLTAINAHGRGITSLAMIHDSYATHACDVRQLHGITRECFVDIHDRDILVDLHVEWCERTGLDLPPPPPPGKLDVKQVMKSLYFFH